MDILKPKLQYIDGICYRINPGKYSSDFDEGTAQPYYEFDSECGGMVEPETEDNYDVEQDQNGRYITRFHVAKLFFSYIIGAKGSTKRRIEGETRTTITVPKIGCTGDIVISGQDRKSVCSARNRINMLVMSARKGQPLTHFLSVPLINEVFVQKFMKFKENVLEICPGIEPDLFQFPESLHLTIDVLKLCDDIEREQAASALEKCHRTVLASVLGGRRELRVRMHGLDYMNDDPSAVRVLYGRVVSVDEPSLLQNLLDAVRGYFIKEGLVENQKVQRDGVLIHATLMNAKFCENKSNTGNAKKQSFDASTILEVFKDYDFGEACISRLDLSAFYTNTENTYWKATATIDLFKF